MALLVGTNGSLKTHVVHMWGLNHFRTLLCEHSLDKTIIVCNDFFSLDILFLLTTRLCTIRKIKNLTDRIGIFVPTNVLHTRSRYVIDDTSTCVHLCGHLCRECGRLGGDGQREVTRQYVP